MKQILSSARKIYKQEIKERKAGEGRGRESVKGRGQEWRGINKAGKQLIKGSLKNQGVRVEIPFILVC